MRRPIAGRWLAARLCLTLVVAVVAETGCVTPKGTAPAKPTVRVGLERVEAGEVPSLAGQRIGLVVHAASVTVDGRHAVDVFADCDLSVLRLFSPEHGLRGRAAAGEAVADDRDPVTDLPVVSLYGEHRAPQPADLEGLDVLVFDLQGAGVRFYTYVSTMILCLQAAAAADLPFVVLDRPNPLGGERVEGPSSAPRDIVAESFVNLAPGPLVHGLTMGEMARYVNATLASPARLEVVPMSGWRRTMSWSDTGRRWVPPSPNLRTAEAAMAYPGTAFLEATNITEGRGTPAPFLWIGAPWIDVMDDPPGAPGFRLVPHRFTPVASAAAPEPKYRDEECRGWRVELTDATTADPYRLGVALARHLSYLPDFEWRRDGEALTWLLGTPRVLEQLQGGATVDEIVDADRRDHLSWREARRPALLY